MDVLAAHAYGFDVALAPLGTAFSNEQAELLKRYTSNVIIAFDMDNAGRLATEKTSLILKKYGFNIRVLELKNAKDPDEFLKKYGKTEFLKSVKKSKEIFDFLYDFYVKEYDLSNFMAKQNFIGRFKEFFLSVETDLEKSLYLNKLSVSLGMEKEVKILRKILIQNNEGTILVKKIQSPHLKTKILKIDELELETLKLCLKDRKYFKQFKNRTITSPFVQNIFDIINQNGEKNYIQELLRGNFFKLEEEEEEIILNISTELSAKNEEDIINTYIEIYKRWFVKEIDEKMSFFKTNDIKSFLNCKKIYEKIISDIKIDDLEENYKEFISMKI